MANALEVETKLMAIESWENSGNANSMWDNIAGCIREAARKVLGMSRGRLN